MTFTDNGTKVKRDWMPLAMANGIEWMRLRRNHSDRFYNLYRRGLVNKTLWLIGALLAFVFRSIEL